MGLLLRQKFYPRYLKKCGRNVLFGRFVDICGGKEKISIGSGVIVNDFARLDGSEAERSDATLEIGDNVFIGAGTTLTLTRGSLTIESGANLGSGCVVRSDGHIVIENDVLVAAFCHIGKQCDDDKKHLRKDETSSQPKGTQIGSGCWIGVRARIADGVHIGKGTIVGAHSIVTSDLPDYIVAVGNPAKALRQRVAKQNG